MGIKIKSLKIKSLKIRNFRCIGELDLDFTDPDGNPLDLVVLAGPNGCGKTSVLEAILIACGRKQLMAASAENPLSNMKIGAENFEIKADVQIDGEHVTLIWQIEYQWDDKYRTKKPVIAERDSCPEYLRLRRDEEIPIAYFSSWRGPKLVGALPVTIGSKQEPVERTEDNRLWIFKQKCIDSWTGALYENSKREPMSDHQTRALFDPLNDAWRIFYPGRQSRFIVAPVGKREGFELMLEYEDGARIPVEQLSSGEIEVLTMAGWFTMNDYKGGIVLIDEPELHMHVQWHWAMMRALRKLLPDSQIIAATHSWDILESVMDYERFTLLPEGDPRTAIDNKAVIR